MADKTLIGQRIKELRIANNYSTEEFSNRIGLTSRFIYDIESGRTGVSLDKLVKICETLNVSVDYILFGDNTNESTIQPELFTLLEKCPEYNKEYLTEIIKSFILSLVDTNTVIQTTDK